MHEVLNANVHRGPYCGVSKTPQSQHQSCWQHLQGPSNNPAFSNRSIPADNSASVTSCGQWHHDFDHLEATCPAQVSPCARKQQSHKAKCSPDLTTVAVIEIPPLRVSTYFMHDSGRTLTTLTSCVSRDVHRLEARQHVIVSRLPSRNDTNQQQKVPI